MKRSAKWEVRGQEDIEEEDQSESKYWSWICKKIGVVAEGGAHHEVKRIQRKQIEHKKCGTSSLSGQTRADPGAGGDVRHDADCARKTADAKDDGRIRSSGTCRDKVRELLSH